MDWTTGLPQVLRVKQKYRGRILRSAEDRGIQYFEGARKLTNGND
jgi:hypothetical protein